MGTFSFLKGEECFFFQVAGVDGVIVGFVPSNKQSVSITPCSLCANNFHYLSLTHYIYVQGKSALQCNALSHTPFKTKSG